MRTAALRRTTALGSVLLLGTLAGCGDPPPDPSVAPVEVVLDGCVLNRDSITVGSHDLTVIGAGSVTVVAPDGEPLITHPGGTAVPRTFHAIVPGTYGVQCRATDGTPVTDLPLRVDPAS